MVKLASPIKLQTAKSPIVSSVGDFFCFLFRAMNIEHQRFNPIGDYGV